MEIDYAFLADLAQATPDGKVSVIGGGINEIYVPSFPAIQQVLALVVRIELQPAECGRPHRLEVLFWDPDDAALPPNLDATFTAERNPRYPTAVAYVQLAAVMGQIALPRAGDYAFLILLDGNQRKRLPLRVSLISDQTRAGA